MISSPSEVTTAKAPIKGAIGCGYSQLDQRTLFLSTLSQRPPVTVRAIYANPADALSSGSISDCTENGFSR
jgi:hypothetical protein